MVAEYVEGGYETFDCNVAIPQYSRVKLVSGLIVEAGAEDAIGTVVAQTFAAGGIAPASVTVRLRTAQGTAIFVAAGAITAGAKVYAAASGQISATANAFPVGTAIDAATVEGDWIQVLPGGSNDIGAAGAGAYGLVELAASVAELTDSTGGTAGSTLAAIAAGATYDQADLVAVKNAIASLNASVSAILTNLKAAGSMASP
ncbi:MAG TPA: hypothetical protein VGG64_12690 [Pirellulales bacterium]|jgi:hypothetical protein